MQQESIWVNSDTVSKRKNKNEIEYDKVVRMENPIKQTRAVLVAMLFDRVFIGSKLSCEL